MSPKRRAALVGSGLIVCAIAMWGASGAGAGGGNQSSGNLPQEKLDVINKGEAIHARQIQDGPVPAPPSAKQATPCPQRGGSGAIESYGPAGAAFPGGRGYNSGTSSSTAEGAPVLVYAGVDPADPTQGVLRVEKLPKDLCAAELAEAGVESLSVGDHAGPVELVRVDGPHVTFRFVESGCRASYDIVVRPGAANSLHGRLVVPPCEGATTVGVATASAP